MRPDRIMEILDLAKEAREKGLVFNPMFQSDAGVGKSEICRQWVKQQQEIDPESGFVDCRIAYYDGPDFVGYPKDYMEEIIIDGIKKQLPRMTHCLPEMWPTSGKGLFLFEEPNRGNTMVMNCLMQVLTDREVGVNYKLPDGWILAGCVNPEGAKYDVNNMDTALKDRFEWFDIDYDFNTFMHYIETAGWHQNVINFVKSGQWVYKTPDAVGKEGKYISPRTLSKLNAAEQSGASDHESKRALHRIVCQSILGKHVGNEYWKTCWDDAPILAQDIINDQERALKKLKTQSKSGDSYAGDKVAITVDSIIENYGGYFEGRKMPNGDDWPHEEGTIDEPTMVAVAEVIPSDQAINLIKGCGHKVHKGQITSYFKEFYKRNKQCIKIMRDNIKIDRAVNRK